MATKRQILESLNHKDLLAIAESFELSIENRRRKGNVVDAVVASRTAKLPHVLKEFSLSQLKETCRKLKIEVSGRTKVDFIEGLLGKKSVKAITAKPAKATTKATAKAKTTAKAPATKAKAKKNGATKAKVATAAKAPTKAKTTVAKVKAKAKDDKKTADKKGTTKKVSAKKAVEKKAAPKKAPQKASTKKASKKTTAKKTAAPKVKKTKTVDAPPAQDAQEAPAAAQVPPPTAPDYSRVVRPEAPAAPSSVKCIACKSKVTVATCQANGCSTTMLASDTRKICAGCWFDRSGGSFDFFLKEYKKDTTCPDCNKHWTNFDD